MPATTKVVVSDEQYRALQRPVVLPTPQELFDCEVETLVGKGLATYDMADSFRKDIPTGRLFLLVPPPPAPFDLAHLMSLVILNGKQGKNFLNAADLTDEVEVPQGRPYLMTEVEDGDSRRNTKQLVNRANILAEGRSPYVTWEGIVHTIVFPGVLMHHALDLVGSRCRSGNVPRLCLFSGVPELNRARWNDNACPWWGAPSCGRRTVDRHTR